MSSFAEDPRVLPEILRTLVNDIGFSEPFFKLTYIGPYLITLFLQSTPLHNQNTIWSTLMDVLEPLFYERIHHCEDLALVRHRNICTILSFYAEKLYNVKIDNRKDVNNSILTRIVMFLIKIINFSQNEIGSLIRKLYALICLEKLCQNCK